MAILALQTSAFAQDKAAKIDQMLSLYQKYGQFNGSALVADNGKVIYKKGLGLANMEWDIPNAPDTKFRLGSITKQFTATLILQLVEQGKIKLDGKLIDYLPDYRKDTGAKVTIESFSYDYTYQKEVLLGSSKSDAYDVVVLDSPWVGQFADGGFVDDLKERINANAQVIAWNDFVPSFCQVSEWKGKLIAIPFGAYFVLWNYRSDHVR